MDKEGANNNFRLAYYDGKIVLLLLSFPFVEIKQSLRPLELIYWVKVNVASNPSHANILYDDGSVRPYIWY